MSAVAVKQLPRGTALGARWGGLVELARPSLRPRTDPWVLYAVDLGAGFFDEGLPTGPLIYAALGLTEWQYCGQTLVPLRDRLMGHRNDARGDRRHAKWAGWLSLTVLSLRSTTSAHELDALERAGKELLRPRMGTRWPRQRD